MNRGVFSSVNLSSVNLSNMRELRRNRGGTQRVRSRRARADKPGSLAASTLAERIYQQLKSDIIHNFFQDGEAINEKVLASRYKGSRTPVREAIMRLQQE